MALADVGCQTWRAQLARFERNVDCKVVAHESRHRHFCHANYETGDRRSVHLIGCYVWQSARIPYLSKLDEIGTEAKMDEFEGQK
jgi:hypothetical protein